MKYDSRESLHPYFPLSHSFFIFTTLCSLSTFDHSLSLSFFFIFPLSHTRSIPALFLLLSLNLSLLYSFTLSQSVPAFPFPLSPSLRPSYISFTLSLSLYPSLSLTLSILLSHYFILRNSIKNSFSLFLVTINEVEGFRVLVKYIMFMLSPPGFLKVRKSSLHVWNCRGPLRRALVP